MLTSDEWKDNTRWHLVQNSRIVYQILKIHHPEYRRILRQKDENNKRKVRIAKEEITKLEIPLYETNFGLWLVDLEENQGKATDELLAQIETKQKKIQPIFDKINFDPYAFWHHKEFEKEISEVLEGA
jgi:phage-related baseplate assembly protein